MKIEIKNDFSEWRRFAEQADVACGFWCDPVVVEQFAGDKNNLRVVYVYDADILIAVLPFRYSKDTIPFKIGLWRLGGACAEMFKLPDYEFPIKNGYERKSVFFEVADWFKKKKDADLLMADNWSGTEKYVRNIQITYLIDMPDSFDEYMRLLSSNTRQVLRRKARKIARDSGKEITYRVFCKMTEMEPLYEYLYIIWEKSWHGRLKSQPPPFLNVLKKLATSGWVRSYVLFSGETPIAYIQGYQYKGIFYDEAPAYCEDWGRHSPGLVLNYFLLQDLFADNKPAVVDFGFGYNQYKEMLGTRSDVRGQLWLAISIKGMIIRMVLGICDTVFKGGKFVLRRFKLDKRIKQAVKGTK